jgi:hypothetical protein
MFEPGLWALLALPFPFLAPGEVDDELKAFRHREAGVHRIQSLG